MTSTTARETTVHNVCLWHGVDPLCRPPALPSTHLACLARDGPGHNDVAASLEQAARAAWGGGRVNAEAVQRVITVPAHPTLLCSLRVGLGWVGGTSSAIWVSCWVIGTSKHVAQTMA